MFPPSPALGLELSNAEAKYGRAKAMHDERPPLISEQDYADQLTAFQVARSTHAVAALDRPVAPGQGQDQRSELERGAPGLAGPHGQAAGLRPRLRSKTPFAVASRFVSPGSTSARAAMFRLVDPDPIKFRARRSNAISPRSRSGRMWMLWCRRSRAFKGRVARISPQVNANNRTFQVEIHIDNPDGPTQARRVRRGSVNGPGKRRTSCSCRRKPW